MIVGVCGNLPFGLAPGTGLSVYLTNGLVMAGVMSKEEGMTACLLSGVLMGKKGGREGGMEVYQFSSSHLSSFLIFLQAFSPCWASPTWCSV